MDIELSGSVHCEEGAEKAQGYMYRLSEGARTQRSEYNVENTSSIILVEINEYLTTYQWQKI